MHKLCVIGTVIVLSVLSIGMCVVADEPACQPTNQVNIQIKAEFHELAAKDARALQLEGTPKRQKVAPAEFVVSTIDAAGLKALETRLEKNKAELVNRPILSTVSGNRGTIMISSVLPFTDENGEQQFARVDTGFTALPILNNDGSITLSVELTLPHAPNRIQASAERRIAPGSSMTMITADDGSGKGLVAIFSPIVVE